MPTRYRVGWFAPLWVIGVLLCSTDAVGDLTSEVYEIRQGDSFEVAVKRLRPGDTLIVHRGTYSETGRVTITVKGTARSPVLIKGALGEAPPLITRPVYAEDLSTILIEGAAYLTLSGLEITGNGGDGVRLSKNPNHISLENLVIHEVDVGINFRSDMDHITVRRNHIYNTGALGRTGEGMYVGCNYAECVVRDSVIEGNWIHDTLLASQGDGIEIKRGSRSNIIRDNTIYNTKYPGIVVVGTEGKGQNLVESNVVWNCGDAGIQVTADSIVRNNIIFGGPGIGFHSLEHQEVLPGNLEVTHNTIIGGEPCLKLQNWDYKVGLVFANNAVYCESNRLRVGTIDGAVFSGNVVYPKPIGFPEDGYSQGRSPVLDFVDVWNKNAYPSDQSALTGAGDSSYVALFDFNGYPRRGICDVGAYAWRGEKNPGWAIGPGFKKGKSGR